MSTETAGMANAGPTTRKVLIVDDNAGTRKVVARRIQSHGRYLPLQAEGKEDALSNVRSHSDILAVFVDQRIENNDRGGLEILRAILIERPLLPVIMYTGEAVPDIRQEAYDAGALWYLPKVQISGREDVIALLEIASRLVDVMPIDTDPRFLKEILDAVPTEVMVRDRDGHVVYQNREKEREFGSIEKGKTLCWNRYEGQPSTPDGKCPDAETLCACEQVFKPGSDEDRQWPVVRKYRYRGNWTDERGRFHRPGWWHLEASGIGGRNGTPAFAVEAGRDITIEVEMLNLITEIARESGFNEDQILELASNRLVQPVGFARARAWKFDPRTREFVLAAAVGTYPGTLIGRRVGWPEAQLDKLANRKPLVVTRSDLALVASSDLVDALAPAERFLWAPYFVGGELAGLLVVDRKGQPAPEITNLDEFWMDFLGQHVSAVAEIKQRRDDLDWMENLSRNVSGLDTIADVLRIVILALQDRISADVIQFHQLSSKGEMFLQCDNDKHCRECPARKGYKADVGANARACANDEPLFLDNTEEDYDFLDFRRQFGDPWGMVCPGCRVRPKSMACVPIHLGPTVVGSLCVSYSRRHPFSDRERDLLRRVCDSLSIALKATNRLSVVQSQAMEVRRMQGVRIIARGLTHALRNNAQVILNYVGGTDDRVEESSIVREGCRGIRQQVSGMMNLFDALGRLAGEEPGRILAYVHSVITDLVTLQERRFQDHGINLTSDLDPACDAIREDRDNLLLVLVTALENAFAGVQKKQGTGQRTVMIRSTVSEDRASLVITIEDTGVGIPPDVLTTIFEWPSAEFSGKPAFHRIGLPIARVLAQSMGGEVTVDSQLGEGTTVTITLRIPKGDQP